MVRGVDDVVAYIACLPGNDSLSIRKPRLAFGKRKIKSSDNIDCTPRFKL